MGASPLYVLVFTMLFAGLYAVEKSFQQKQTLQVESSVSASAFLNYRDSVMSYAISNPSFSGVAPITWSGQSGGNAIIKIGQRRAVVCYALLPSGSLSDVLRISKNDASIGIAASTTTWSSHIGTNYQTLPVTVPQGAIVAYVQI